MVFQTHTILPRIEISRSPGTAESRNWSVVSPQSHYLWSSFDSVCVQNLIERTKQTTRRPPKLRRNSQGRPLEYDISSDSAHLKGEEDIPSNSQPTYEEAAQTESIFSFHQVSDEEEVEIRLGAPSRLYLKE